MQVSKVKTNDLGEKRVKGLLDCGTILRVDRQYGKVGYTINKTRVKSTGVSNKQFAKHFKNFSVLVNLTV